ncbi:MAG: AraC family transcriptional regulator [Lachnospiraceae bacterium]|nr:AraC family transcriptional regulator [Lachnospiraceae bacterium]
MEKAAIASGFDSKYFARVVKQYYGCTPRDWKDYGW